MQTLTIRNPANMRTGYDTGAAIIEKQVAKGRSFPVELLLFPRPGEIWAKLSGSFAYQGLPSNAYICVMQPPTNVYGDLTGQPDTHSGNFDDGWNARGIADAQAAAVAIESLRK